MINAHINIQIYRAVFRLPGFSRIHWSIWCLYANTISLDDSNSRMSPIVYFSANLRKKKPTK